MNKKNIPYCEQKKQLPILNINDLITHISFPVKICIEVKILRHQ